MTLLTSTEQDRVAAAINAVERETDAELVTVLARQADSYAYIPLLWAAILALLLPGLVNYFTEWFDADLLLLVQWGVFLVLGALFGIPRINTRLIPAMFDTGGPGTLPDGNSWNRTCTIRKAAPVC